MTQAAAPRWVRLRLDVGAFDAGAFAGTIDRCRRDGVGFTTMADLGDHDTNHRRLYELNRACSADIPERGAFSTYEEYRTNRIDPESYDPTAVVIAMDGDQWVGMSAASNRRDVGYFFNEMTGVVRSHRGRGIATAMKVLVIQHVAELGLRTLRTFYHPAPTRHRSP